MSTHSLKAQWGAPPKPNLWKVEHSVDHEGHKKWTVTSPAMAGAVMLIHSKRSYPEWLVNYYYDRKETHSRSTNYKRIYSYFAHENGEMTDAECLEHFLSERFYRVILNFIGNGLIELKVPKVASSKKLELQWGDPVKSNLWKVEYDKAFTQYTIKSPVLKGHFVVKVYPPSSAEIEFFDATRGVTWARYLGPVTIEDILSRQFYLESIKPAIYLTHEVRLKKGLKVASSDINSDIKLQWGDPPKPNVWKVKERPGRGFKHRGYIFDISTPLDPNLGIYIHQTPSIGTRKVYRTSVYYGSNCIIDNASSFIVSEGAHPADTFSTQYFWGRIKDEIRDKTPTSMKVASSNPKVMWGDPPKPNLWKVETLQRSKMVTVTRVTSPILEGSIWLGAYGKVMYCPDDMMPSPLTEEKMRAFENLSIMEKIIDITKIMGINPKRQFLSNKFYLEHLAPLIGEGRIKLKGNVRVASSKLQAQWGDPPKPNLWSVEELMYGWEKICRVFSPLIEGEIWLSKTHLVYYFPKGLGLPQRNLGLDYDLRGAELDLSDYPMQRLKTADSEKHFLSHAYWSEHLKGKLTLRGKVASKKSG